MPKRAKFLYKGYVVNFPDETLFQLNGNEQALFLNLLYFSKERGYAYPSQKTLAKYLEWSVKKVQMVTNSLERKGVIKVIRKKHHSSRYILMTSQGKVFETENK